MARIEPLSPPYTPDLADWLARWMPADAGAIEPLALFRVLAHHRELASRMRPLGAGILAHGRLSPREREIVIQRTCARTGASYEWGVHAAVYGPRVGLTPDELAATARPDARWEGSDALLIALADELHDHARLSDELWAALAERYDVAEVLELVIVAGWYRLIAYVIDAAGLSPESWAATMP